MSYLLLLYNKHKLDIRIPHFPVGSHFNFDENGYHNNIIFASVDYCGWSLKNE